VALLDVFQQQHPDELGFSSSGANRLPRTVEAPTLDTRKLSPVKRRHFVLATVGVSITLMPMPASGRLGMSDVVTIRDAIDNLHRMDDRYGSAQLADIADAYLMHVQETMAACTYGSRVEKLLYVTLAELGTAAAWFAFDAGEPERGQHFDDAALRSALLANDRGLQARVWSHMSRQAHDERRYTEAVTMARTALERTRGRVDPRLSALLHTRIAKGHAGAGEAGKSGQALARAETALDSAQADPAPWLAFCGPDELAAQASMCAYALGQYSQAEQYARTSLAATDGERFKRNHFASMVHLAACQVGDRRPDEAAVSAGQALAMLEWVRCPRWEAQLHRVHGRLRAYRSLPEVETFMEEYAQARQQPWSRERARS
jgi:hypothetical protein